MTLDISQLDPSTLELLPAGSTGRVRDHFVEIYEDDDALVESVARFVSLGIDAGEVSVVIATTEHRDALEEKVGPRIDEAWQQGLYFPFNAAETLERISGDGTPNIENFDKEFETVLAAASRGGRQVRIFGEMVALLWERNEVTAALALEDMRNELAERYALRLFCSYPSSVFAEQESERFREMCVRHSHVIAPPRS